MPKSALVTLVCIYLPKYCTVHIHCPLFTLLCPVSTVQFPQFTVHCELSPVNCLLSTVFCPLSSGDIWCSEANRFYSLKPNVGRQQRGIVELLQEMELLRDYDYNAVRLAIQTTHDRALTVYKTQRSI